ncbi:hypothetical protein [Rhizobium binae]|uniref:hypothetical protein n=1 Tax=Rhizobium binae TaxID=1138190 RepID=UPI001C838B72|nr:hypothetical protein [Rhizobium binae]MBX4924423.1 hypothetical protein [Rhizobium binae]
MGELPTMHYAPIWGAPLDLSNVGPGGMTSSVCDPLYRRHAAKIEPIHTISPTSELHFVERDAPSPGTFVASKSEFELIRRKRERRADSRHIPLTQINEKPDPSLKILYR